MVKLDGDDLGKLRKLGFNGGKACSVFHGGMKVPIIMIIMYKAETVNVLLHNNKSKYTLTRIGK